MSASTSKLFQPVQVGTSHLKHRIVLAPLTRFRADKAHVHGDLAVEYYAQRASVPGTMLITEATFIAPQAGGYNNVPGIYNDAQIKAWKRVTDAVHAKGSYIYVQLWALGRAADPKVLEAEGPYPYVSSSATTLTGKDRAARELTPAEIKEYVGYYAHAAKLAVEAGFDGVEIHGANGYLIDQFTQDVSNTRTDAYGGGVEGRTRFALEVVDAVVDAIGQDKTGIRLSPWSPFQDMGMADPKPTFAHIVATIANRYPDFAFVHLVSPRVSAGADLPEEAEKSNDFIRALWAPRPLIVAGGYTAESAVRTADRKGDLVAFGRYFISNPDLPHRIEKGIAFTPYNRDTFYNAESPVGYTDYPPADEAKL